MLTDKQDAFGHEIYDYFIDEQHGQRITEIVERDDGYVDASGGPETYFSEYKDWPLYYKKAMRYAGGRVLDIGCGAGRCSLFLQGKALDVVGIDNSPLAVEICRRRGLKDARILPINGISSKLGIFDTILMLGNNFGLFGSFDGARRLLEKLSKITSPGGRIIAETNDVYNTDNLDHLGYHEFNRNRGRMGGQVRIKVRYRKYATPWFDYLMVSEEEMQNILDGTAWQLKRVIKSRGSIYIAIIGKKKR